MTSSRDVPPEASVSHPPPTTSLPQGVVNVTSSRDAPPEVSTAHPPSITSLPQEVFNMIIAHLTLDKRALLACCLTCYSCYIAAVPHLHHTLITRHLERGQEKFWWPHSFYEMHKLGLFPLVKRFQVHGSFTCWMPEIPTFSPELFDHHILHQFSSLTNVRELGIDDLDIPSFMPKFQQYFNHFLPTVRSLALRRPRGSKRQIIFFIGLFQHLEDLRLPYRPVWARKEPPDDLTLVPFYSPPLRGKLTMWGSTWVGMLEQMVGLFRIQFRHMDIMDSNRVQFLLNACGETLETLQFYPGQHQGEQVSLKGVQIITKFPSQTLRPITQHITSGT